MGRKPCKIPPANVTREQLKWLQEKRIQYSKALGRPVSLSQIIRAVIEYQRLMGGPLQ